MTKGSCLCGAVTFRIRSALEDPQACHCQQCRKQSGHYFAAARTRKDAVELIQDTGLCWYRASDIAARGFCKNCGSTLFWRSDDGPFIRVALGSLESTSGLHLLRHVGTSSKGSYYNIADGLPQEGEDEE